MVDVSKAFSQEPPREPLVNLGSIVRDFHWRYKKTKKTDQVVNYCRTAPDFKTAVERAVEARDAAGKHHNHQSKVDLGARRELGRRIIQNKGHMLSAMRIGAHGTYTQFDAMYDFIDAMKPKGIGPVTIYDVAVRIGAFLEVEPQSVYMHAGVKQAMTLLVETYRIWALKQEGPQRRWVRPEVPTDIHSYAALEAMGADKMLRVPRFGLPIAFKKVKADDVEDILCTYRTVFTEWYEEVAEK